MHLTQYTDDRQVVTYLAKHFEQHGLRAVLFDPTQLRPGLRALSGTDEIPLKALFRFFPGDWLERLPAETAWQELVRSDVVCNPLTTLLTQSKRFPLVWPLLKANMSTWKALTPETFSPDDVDIRSPDWVLKPAFGHEGSCVSIAGVSKASVVAAAPRQARRAPGQWVAQRRFDFLPIDTPDGLRYACVGVFVIDGRAEGAYARVSANPLINDTVQDAAVLLEEES
jgi:glutathionylspermidine synthase